MFFMINGLPTRGKLELYCVLPCAIVHRPGVKGSRKWCDNDSGTNDDGNDDCNDNYYTDDHDNDENSNNDNYVMLMFMMNTVMTKVR